MAKKAKAAGISAFEKKILIVSILALLAIVATIWSHQSNPELNSNHNAANQSKVSSTTLPRSTTTAPSTSVTSTISISRSSSFNVSPTSRPASNASYNYAMYTYIADGFSYTTGGSISAAIQSGYNMYLCAGASQNLSSYSWNYVRGWPYGPSTIGYQSGSNCTVNTNDQNGTYYSSGGITFGDQAAVAGIGINATNSTFFGNEEYLGTYGISVNFTVVSSGSYVVYLIADNEDDLPSLGISMPASEKPCVSSMDSAPSILHHGSNLSYAYDFAGVEACGPLNAGNYTFTVSGLRDPILVVYVLSN